MSRRSHERIGFNRAWTGNIGEWSEPYVVYKLLADGKLYQADEKFNPSPDDFLQILSIIRDDVSADRGGNGFVTFKSKDANGEEATSIVSVDDIAAKAAKILGELVSNTSANGAFSIPWLETELKKLGFSTHKNPIPDSQRSVKRDITLKVQDPKSGGMPTLGFSVKSEVGAPPHLLNAGETTNIVYRIKGLSAKDVVEINQYNAGEKQIWKCTEIKKRASSIEFERYNCQMFADNLDIVDAALPQIMADFLKVHYFETLTGPRPRIQGVQRPHDRLTKALSILNTLPQYKNRRANYCEIKIKRFLRACALGLVPSEVWNDVDDANGGYIIVLPTGELIGFYVYNRLLFEDYLLNNTNFERGSTSRHKYMQLEQDAASGDCLLKLNLAIRFAQKC